MDWDQRYSVGEPQIDGQHQELFERVTRLTEAMAAGDPSEIVRLLDFLGVYVVEHFRDEERLMEEACYPLLGPHRLAHQRFVVDFRALQVDYDSNGSTPWLALRVQGTVTEWLRKHILGMDQQLGRHLAERRRQGNR